MYFNLTVNIVNVNIGNGDNEIRTRDLLLARQALSQLSYTPDILINMIFLK